MVGLPLLLLALAVWAYVKRDESSKHPVDGDEGLLEEADGESNTNTAELPIEGRHSLLYF